MDGEQEKEDESEPEIIDVSEEGEGVTIYY
jgi:hypothetical protein